MLFLPHRPLCAIFFDRWEVLPWKRLSTVGLICRWRLDIFHIRIAVAVGMLEAGLASGNVAAVGLGLVTIVKSGELFFDDIRL